MVVRRTKKYRKKRGERTCGKGSHKKNRGAGSRGGRGRSGFLKHKKSWAIKYEPDYFEKKGFTITSKVKRKVKVITLRDIDVIAKKINKNEIDISELGYDKVLSTGNITQPLIIKARKFVDRAKQKIENMGGKAIENA